ncbi:hypothetical protein HanXRQr2_Chr12g0558131 [Helianthus annuus]|uniref:Uncharacterized protein n=1 Tax=Helianthus annuus TaxID=4232 RepID=A0A9K3MXG6_HELAN|nr:hypothetical protein HanXRQr2_Chr12g0558131 [Helianthus annuus]KAJ0864063.1 hypothetical protein HanPSC8_Chr12g0537341 [Helianthus annuus]
MSDKRLIGHQHNCFTFLSGLISSNKIIISSFLRNKIKSKKVIYDTIPSSLSAKQFANINFIFRNGLKQVNKYISNYHNSNKISNQKYSHQKQLWRTDSVQK